jgi:integrase
MDTFNYSTQDAGALLLSTRQLRGVSANYLLTLRSMLAKLARFYNGPLAAFPVFEFEAWLGTMKPRTSNNYLRLARQLTAFARRRKLLPPGWDELAALEFRIVPVRSPCIYSPAEARRLLAACPEEILAPVALVLFAGLRTAEALRISWGDVDFTFKRITIPAAVAKTRAVRFCTLMENLAGWLARTRGSASLPIFAGTAKRFHDVLTVACKRAGVTRRRNGLRHSFVSYRLAQTCDASRVALESGHSEAMLVAHYRALVTAEAAREWFAIFPETGQMELLAA